MVEGRRRSERISSRLLEAEAASAPLGVGLLVLDRKSVV